MLLAIDIGNSNISVGLFNSEKVLQYLTVVLSIATAATSVLWYIKR